MKTVGLILMGLTCLLIFVKFKELSLSSIAVGVALGAALFVMLTALQAPAPAITPLQAASDWKNKVQELEFQTSQTIEGLNQEVQKLQQKLMRTEERCLSYQKLVDVHQGEIDKLQHENGHLSQQVIEKDRKIAESQLARLEPDLFDGDKRQVEIAYRELKKRFEEKSQVLDETRAKLFRIENELLAFQKQKQEESHDMNFVESALMEQLKVSEEEKRKIETELVSLQQLVSQLSLAKESSRAPRKKKVTTESGSRDLLG